MAKRYKDIDGNECSIMQMVRREPEWAANMVQCGAVAIKNVEILLVACKAAYRKHHMNDDSIGWEELGNLLLDSLCNVIGTDGYQKWVDSVSGEKQIDAL